MEDGASQTSAVVEAAPTGLPSACPPPPPDPNVDDTAAAVPLDPTPVPKSDEPVRLESAAWDVNAVSGLGALRMLVRALETLAEATGDVPPTPPVSRPSTPKKVDAQSRARRLSSSSSSSTTRSNNKTAAAAAGGESGDIPSMPKIGTPEAQPHEPIAVEVGAHAEDIAVQHAAIARRFFSKVAPPFTLGEYMLRLHHYCPHSPGVYLGAAAYIHHLCILDLMVPATNRTVHRLALAAVRIAAKALEDNKWGQERVAKVGGVSKNQLMNLEVTLCFLLDFDLFVNEKTMAHGMFLLQQASRHGVGVKGRLSDQFKLKLPLRAKAIRTYG